MSEEIEDYEENDFDLEKIISQNIREHLTVLEEREKNCENQNENLNKKPIENEKEWKDSLNELILIKEELGKK